MDTAPLFEACVANVESAIAAEKAGAGRIELCNVLGAGGITPSYGMIRVVRQRVSIPIHVLIRPREGDFMYSHDELEIMKQDIEFCREAGIDGVVFGLLQEQGSVDVKRCELLKAASGTLSITFHRAFDVVADAFTSMEEIIKLGFHRILTSGQRASAAHGAGFISALMNQARGRIILMPGGGIDDKNIRQLRQTTGATEFHLSARKIKPSNMKYRNEFVILTGEDVDEYTYDVFDPERFKKVMENA